MWVQSQVFTLSLTAWVQSQEPMVVYKNWCLKMTGLD